MVHNMVVPEQNAEEDRETGENSTVRNLMISSHHQIHEISGEQLKESKMGRAFSTHVENRNAYRILWRKR